MTLTEEEARKKWCPFARVPSAIGMNGSAVSGTPAINRAPHVEVTCIASECMAWRWHGPAFEHMETREGEPAPIGWNADPEQHVFRGKIGWRRPRLNRTGYCGLAGGAP